MIIQINGETGNLQPLHFHHWLLLKLKNFRKPIQGIQRILLEITRSKKKRIKEKWHAYSLEYRVQVLPT